jgi:hypothetical protein
MNTYNSESTIVKNKAPRVEFNGSIPNWFIMEFIKYMGKGKIRVVDYQGNELKVRYESH